MAIDKKEQIRRVKVFKHEFNRLVQYFGLYDWEIFFKEDKESKRYKAYCTWEKIKSNEESNGQQAIIFYAKKWIEDKEVSDKEIKQTTFHEFMELLLGRLRDFSVNTSIVISEREIDTEIHRIIGIFENTIYKRGLI